MSNTYTAKIRMRMPGAGDYDWDDEWHDNAKIDDVVVGALLSTGRVITGGAVTDGGGLTASVAAAVVRLSNGQLMDIAAGNLELSAAATGTDASGNVRTVANWIYVNGSGVLTTAVAPPSGDYIPIALVDTSATGILRIADLRPMFVDNSIIPAVEQILATSVNIVDADIYNTLADSDGGAWTDKALTQLWYWETLNTATRGATREFPAIVSIIAETTQITLNDATALGCPMWRVMDFTGKTITSVAMREGVLCVGTAAHGLYRYDFNSGAETWYTTTSTPAILSNVINDVAMTTIDRAPNAYGLLDPVIVAATNSGDSIIDGPAGVGTVVNATFLSQSGNKVFAVNVDDDGYIYSLLGYGDVHPYALYRFAIPNVNTVYNSTYRMSTAGIPALMGDNTAAKQLKTLYNNYAAGGLSGLTRISDDRSMTAHITNAYNTGWMKGDVRRAYFCDAEGTTETLQSLVTNGTFNTDASGWTGGLNTTLSVVSGKCRLQLSGGVGLYPKMGQSIGALISGDVISIFIGLADKITGSNIRMGISTNAPSGSNDSQPSATAIYNSSVDINDGWFTYTATSSAVHYLHLWLQDSGTATDIYYDNIIISKKILDRSVKASSLTVNGTLLRSPVAEGAELQCVSGFSTTNYGVESYSADLDFGTGDMYAYLVVIASNITTNQILLDRQDGAYGTRMSIYINSAGNFVVQTKSGVLSVPAIANQPVLIGLTRRSGVLYGFMNSTVFGSVANVESLSGNFPLYVGIGGATIPATPATNCKIVLYKIGAGSLTDADIAKIYRDELRMCQPESKCTLQSSDSNVYALSHDATTDSLYVGGADKITVFNGLTVVNTLDTSQVKSLSAKNKILLNGNSANAKVNIPQINLKSRLLGA